TLRICQVEDGKEVAHLGTPRGGQFKDWFSAVAVSPDSQTLAATDIAGLVHVWSWGNRRGKRTTARHHLARPYPSRPPAAIPRARCLRSRPSRTIRSAGER